MNEHPLISVITITYNAAETLTPTMESVKSQTFRDYEHLIIDGASTDNTLELARREGGDSLRILSEPDKGLYDAMNKGLDMARGKYVIFLNSGDAFHTPETLYQYAQAAANDFDIIYSDTVIVDSTRKMIAPRHLSVPELLTFQSFSNGMLICHQAFMVKRSIAPKFDLSYKFSSDYDWTIRCIRKTTPQSCMNLHCIGIDYLSDGLTDKNKIKSLKERFHIMHHHYGLAAAVERHLSFIPRALKRRMK